MEQREKVALSVENFTRHRIITRAVNERAKAWIIFKSTQTIMDIVTPNWSVKWGGNLYLQSETFFCTSHLTFSFFLGIIMMKARWSFSCRVKLWGCWKNFDHFLIEMKIKIMRSEKKNIRVEFIQAVLMTSESMIQQGVTQTAKSYSPYINGRFYINIFYSSEPCEPFHRPTGESMM